MKAIMASPLVNSSSSRYASAHAQHNGWPLPTLLHLHPSAPHRAQEFLALGVSVLLSDVDILTLKNPFDHLYRDEDIEALSDGFDPQTAYGECGVWFSPQLCHAPAPGSSRVHMCKNFRLGRCV